MSIAKPTESWIGKRVRRREDPQFLRGQGRYLDDLRRPGTLHVAFVRSDVPHASVKRVDTPGFDSVSGVVGVYRGADLAKWIKPTVAATAAPTYQSSEMPALAEDRVRYVGEPIVAIVAESRHAAEDGASEVAIEYEPLEHVLEIAAALSDDAPQIHETVSGNAYNHFRVATGDIEAAFEKADAVVDCTFTCARCASVCLEPRGIMAEWEPDGTGLTVWCGHQMPHVFRTGLAGILDLPESRIRVIVPDVGGAFGAKTIIYQEDMAIIAIARATGRPVKWVSDRHEDMMTTMQGREQIHEVQAAVRADGYILGLRAKIMANNGAYAPWPLTAAIDSAQAAEYLSGPYEIPAYEREVHAVATNKCMLGPYRGVGRVNACLTMETTMDAVARSLDLDPLEVRRRNVIRSYPYDTAGGLRLEGGSSAESLDKIEDLIDLKALQAQHAKFRQDGIYRGIGFSASIEHTAFGAQHLARKGLNMVLGMEAALMRVEPDGGVTVMVGTHSHGQGHETTFAQLVAEELGISLEQISIRYGDTSMVPFGAGTFASRSLVCAGGAIMLASESIREKMKVIAAHHLEVRSDDLVFERGQVHVDGVPGRNLSFAEIAHIANHKPNLLPDAIEPGLEIVRRYRPPDPGSFSNGLHACIVEVDVETGFVSILRYIVIEDCGRIVNPMIVEGQMHGGVAQGIGQTLTEDAHYDANGQPVAITLADYLVPTFTDIPRIEIYHIETPSPLSLGGFKGMAEGGAINAPGAICNAISDALAPFGVVVDRTPVTPEWIVNQVSEAMRDV